MIGKQFQSSNFRPILEYVHNKSGAKLIGGNMVGKEPSRLREEFEVSSGYRNRAKKCVYHVSLSVSPSEHLSDKKWLEIAKSYLKGMLFDENQYVIYRHTDREHEHIHIIANRIKVTNGSVISDSWDYTRSQKLLRELEKEFGLLTPSSWSKSDGISTRREINIKRKLQKFIEESLNERPSLDRFINILNTEDVSVRLRKSPEEIITGISYKLDGLAFQGSKLGKEYCWKSIENRLAKIIPSEQVFNMSSNKRQSVESENLEKQKKILREKYIYLVSKLQNIPQFKDKQAKKIDLGVAILSLRVRESLNEIKQTITQSDTVNRWRKELPREEFLKIARDYIEEVVSLAVIYVEKHQSKEESLLI